MPVLDRAGMIGDLLDSLVAQDYPTDRHEIIVVDNGSSDGTQRVVEAYPVQLLSETRRRSSYAARNRGIEASRGEIVAFTDSDCIASPAWIRELVHDSTSSEYGAFAGEVVAYQSVTRLERYAARGRERMHHRLLHHPYLPCVTTSNVAYRRAVLDEIGPFDPTMRSGGDTDIAWRMHELTPYRIAYRPNAIVSHRNRTTLAGMWRQSRSYGEGVAALERRHPAFHRDHSARAGSSLWRNALHQTKVAVLTSRRPWMDEASAIDALAFRFFWVVSKVAFNRGVRQGRRAGEPASFPPEARAVR